MQGGTKRAHCTGFATGFGANTLGGGTQILGCAAVLLLRLAAGPIAAHQVRRTPKDQTLAQSQPLGSGSARASWVRAKAASDWFSGGSIKAYAYMVSPIPAWSGFGYTVGTCEQLSLGANSLCVSIASPPFPAALPPLARCSGQATATLPT